MKFGASTNSTSSTTTSSLKTASPWGPHLQEPRTDFFIQVDEEGYFKNGDLRVTDAAFGKSLLENLRRDERNRFLTRSEGRDIVVEAFDEPLVATQVRRAPNGDWELATPYDFRARFQLASLSLDEWDRFHGLTESGLPFVLSRAAQAEFFNTLEDFDDESVSDGGHRHVIPAWLSSKPDVNTADFWSHIYRTEIPGWELEAPAAALKPVLAQLKIPKCRVLVPGCGSGNDAAYFAELGHIVTGVDMSEEALKRARQKYGHLKNITWIQGDVFKLTQDWNSQFDLVFEHTLYCAITPERRNELVATWKRLLTDRGHLLGVFFAMDKRMGPPFGGSEWEIRERLRKSFEFLYWTRWRHSIEKRQGLELVVYAQKTRRS